MPNSKNNTKFDRNKTVWGTYDGRRILIRNLSDSHLANILHFLEKHQASRDGKDVGLYLFLMKEVQLRGLKQEFLDRAQIPHIGADGKWHLWDFDKDRDMIVSKTKAINHGR